MAIKAFINNHYFYNDLATILEDIQKDIEKENEKDIVEEELFQVNTKALEQLTKKYYRNKEGDLEPLDRSKRAILMAVMDYCNRINKGIVSNDYRLIISHIYVLVSEILSNKAKGDTAVQNAVDFLTRSL